MDQIENQTSEPKHSVVVPAWATILSSLLAVLVWVVWALF